MTKDFSCRTCGNLRTEEWDNEASYKTMIYYSCRLGIAEIKSNPDNFFCADHTDRETVKRIREGV